MFSEVNRFHGRTSSCCVYEEPIEMQATRDKCIKFVAPKSRAFSAWCLHHLNPPGALRVLSELLHFVKICERPTARACHSQFSIPGLTAATTLLKRRPRHFNWTVYMQCEGVALKIFNFFMDTVTFSTRNGMSTQQRQRRPATQDRTAPKCQNPGRCG